GPLPGRGGGEYAAGAAADYDRELRGMTLDLVLLGLGPDGHVASLFPEAPELNETERLAVPAEPKLEPYVERGTLTPPAPRAAPRAPPNLLRGHRRGEGGSGGARSGGPAGARRARQHGPLRRRRDLCNP